MVTTPQPRTRGRERRIVHAFADSVPFGHVSAQAALLVYRPVDAHPFPDGETLVTIHRAGCWMFIDFGEKKRFDGHLSQVPVCFRAVIVYDIVGSGVQFRDCYNYPHNQ